MKKCLSCNAVLRESTKPTPIPALRQKPTDGTAEVSAVRVRHDCTQSGIVTGPTPLPSAEAQISSANGPSEPEDSQTGSPDPLGAPVEKMIEAGAESTTKIVEAEPTSVTGKEEVNQAGVEHSADATGQFCRHCGAAMESGSAICGDCGTHKIRPDRLKISLSRVNRRGYGNQVLYAVRRPSHRREADSATDVASRLES